MYFGVNIVNEETIISTNNISVQINPTTNTNFRFDPYIKVYVGQSMRNSKGVARIYLKDATYVKEHSGIKVVELNKDQRLELNILMRSVDDDKISNYQKALNFVISRCNLSKDFYKNYSIPDFTEIKYRD